VFFVIRACLLLIILLTGCFAFCNEQKVPDFKIVGIEAHLYYEPTGKISKDVLADPSFGLFNAFIGGGSAASSSSTTLVVIDISCPKQQVNVPPSRKLKVVVTQGAKTIQSSTLDFPFVEATGKLFMPVFIYGHNENPLKVTAFIVGLSRRSSITKTIGFTGGE